MSFKVRVPVIRGGLSIAAVCILLAGCGTTKPVIYSGLDSSAQLAPNPRDDSGRVPYSYATQVDWRRYDRIIIDPVAIYRSPDNQFGKMSEEDKATLAAYMQATFQERLSSRFAAARRPGPGTLRLKLTLTGAKTSTPFLATASRFDIGGGLYNSVQAARGREGAFTGSVIYSVEIYDAATDRLLDAYVTRQYPRAMNVGASIGSLAAAKTGIDMGAKTLAKTLR